MAIRIKGLSKADAFRLGLEAVKESLKPSRCPTCQSANVQEKTCTAGSLCGFNCGGGGWQISCGSCDIIINEAECEENEEL